jgi:hypothetical protein
VSNVVPNKSNFGVNPLGFAYLAQAFAGSFKERAQEGTGPKPTILALFCNELKQLADQIHLLQQTLSGCKGAHLPRS